ncbi:protein containing von Willebrand factor type A domain [Sulfurimonas gotlandica GD1]|uniref:Protein containing von Willebrand factor type A domain n=1 Tax=Sulfurimonas gotlandica (strain DSM 19862 / JCM 16533 / GD1) TaxID=929558 RepID=B6BN56_SULGG|nr:VWA domain-containing protein [Sulfurimonas gotlandica]EDZ61634.1 von Willebrand factor, type A [Sulfurimonas gotlandica GD1]EHP30667.1 protein containing von Willebrand factor type A domain [Sulfurimonas gotlandica GD1]
MKPIYFVHLHFLSAKKNFLKLEWIVKVLIFISLCIALASPIVVDKLSPNNRHGKDIVLAIDASGSMNSSGFDFEDEVSDGKRLSRFEITKIIASEFIQKRISDNVGVVLYGDFAFIASPITYEKEIVTQMLGYLTQGMAGQNTAIGEAIAMGVRSFKHSKAKTKVIVLLSDGEHNSGSVSPKEATELAKEQGIKIYTIAMGNKGEADEALLETIAKDSNGEFFSASSAKELKNIYDEIDKLESSNIKSREYVLKNYFYQIFLLLASGLLLFLLYREIKK